MNEPFSVSRERLDDAYNSATELYEDVNNLLAAYPAETLRKEIKSTFSVLTETIETVDSSPYAFRKIVNPKAGANPVRTPFYAVFMAFFRLIIRESKQPVDCKKILIALNNLATKLETASHHVKSKDRRSNIDLTVGLIQQHFVYKEPPLLSHGPGLAIDFENSLRRSKIETPRYEFKQGLYDLSPQRQKNSSLVPRIAEVACSIANITPGADGYIYIGVADAQADATRIATLDNVSFVEIGHKYVVGVDREAVLGKQSVEQYVRNLVAEIRQTGLSEPLKSALLGSVDTILYRGMSVVRLTVPGQRGMSWVGDKSFIREGSETKEATPKQVAAITARFSKSTN